MKFEIKTKSLVYCQSIYVTNKKEDLVSTRPSFKNYSWQRLTLPAGRPTSTISAEGLNCRVRDGNGWFPLAIVTRKLKTYSKFTVGLFKIFKNLIGPLKVEKTKFSLKASRLRDDHVPSKLNRKKEKFQF